jgi:hypothetical protein
MHGVTSHKIIIVKKILLFCVKNTGNKMRCEVIAACEECDALEYGRDFLMFGEPHGVTPWKRIFFTNNYIENV